MQLRLAKGYFVVLVDNAWRHLSIRLDTSQCFSCSCSVRMPTWAADGDGTVACAATPSSVGRSKEASTHGATVVCAATPSSAGRSKEASTCGTTWARATPAPPLPIRPSEANMPTTNPLHSCRFMTFLSSGSRRDDVYVSPTRTFSL